MGITLVQKSLENSLDANFGNKLTFKLLVSPKKQQFVSWPKQTQIYCILL